MLNRTNAIRLFFALFMLTALCVFTALAQTTSGRNPQSEEGSCEQFKGKVIQPDLSTDYKLQVRTPDETVKAKGIVINPCNKQLLTLKRPSPTNPLHNKVSPSSASESKSSLTAEGRLKSPAELLPASEMLRRARLAQEQKERNTVK